jgi:gamma-butyrobetaine dioxygenase
MDAEVAVRDNRLSIRWGDGHRSAFHAMWLRDHCPCPACRHPATGQRLLETAGLPDDLRLVSARVAGAAVEAVWSDGHAAALDPAWLRHHCYCEADRAAERPRRRFWRAEGRPGLPEAQHADIVADADALREWLAAIDVYGFAVLHGVPVVPGEVTRVAELFGYVRETNYGRLFDVRSVVNPTNLAYTGLGLSCHTDNPYRDPAPTLQLLHCLSSSATGGDSVLVDGFEVAERLRATEPGKFDLLARVPVPFRFQDGDADLRTEQPVITLDVRGAVVAIRLNNRSKAPLRLESDLVEPWYAAYLTFARMLESSAYQLGFKLGPGDLFIVDNLRVLHGRTAFSGAGQRHLQGCYADMDGLRSKLAVLERGRADVIGRLFERMRRYGAGAYLGEKVSITDHMRQAAHAAERDGAPPALIAAALLHDVAYVVHQSAGDPALDDGHPEIGARFLAAHFVPAVSEPVRLHVAAKRYLCAVEPGYRSALSPASIRTLAVQGGPYDEAEARAFAAAPFAHDAVRLRRYDDAAKVVGADIPDLEHYRPLLEGLLIERSVP